MTSQHGNPFDASADPDRWELWEMLVARDIEAFVARDWSAVEDDFDAANFTAIDAGGHSDPDLWTIGFPSLDEYRDTWMRQSVEFADEYADPAAVSLAITTLEHIEISGNKALAHKQFDGIAVTKSGRRNALQWKTRYQCQYDGQRWRIHGFVGYLPLHVGSDVVADGPANAVVAPPSSQHTTAGAYSPVLSVRAEQLVVISGQVALDADGQVPAADIETQTELTLDSCRRQLAAASVDLSDVFKVNVFLADIGDWAAFNEVYRRVMPAALLPVRTAVGASLLPGLRVEIEMWAATR